MFCQVTWPTRKLLGVGVKVGVSVAIGVLVRVEVGIGVGVIVPHGSCVKESCRPELRPPVLHSNWVFCGPAPFWTPTVALVPPLVNVPYTKSNLLWPSYRRVSKLARLALLPYSTARHSILNMRLGALPLVEVKMPQPP